MAPVIFSPFHLFIKNVPGLIANLAVHVPGAGTDIGQMEFYLEADDVDSQWSSIKDKLKEIKVREPFDREYGMREIHIAIPQTNTLLFIGQEIK